MADTSRGLESNPESSESHLDTRLEVDSRMDLGVQNDNLDPNTMSIPPMPRLRLHDERLDFVVCKEGPPCYR